MNDVAASEWEGRDAGLLAEAWGAEAVYLYRSVGSTNDVARRLASGAGHRPAVVLAEEQVEGRGRGGRSWTSPPGVGLWFSVVASTAGTSAAGPLPLRVGLAVAEALAPFAPRIGVKWPNDLCVGERKLGGILCEASWEGPTQGPLVIGVGLNLLQSEDDFPPEIRSRATSLRAATGKVPSRSAVADRVVPAVLRVATTDDALDTRGLEARDLLRGNTVRVTDPMTGALLAQGTAEGVARDGALRVRTAAGLELVRSGTVRVEPPPS